MIFVLQFKNKQVSFQPQPTSSSNPATTLTNSSFSGEVNLLRDGPKCDCSWSSPEMGLARTRPRHPSSSTISNVELSSSMIDAIAFSAISNWRYRYSATEMFISFVLPRWWCILSPLRWIMVLLSKKLFYIFSDIRYLEQLLTIIFSKISVEFAWMYDTFLWLIQN